MKKRQTEQLDRFKKKAREVGTDMSKKEFRHVLGKILKAKPKPEKVSSSSPSKEVPPS